MAKMSKIRSRRDAKGFVLSLALVMVVLLTFTGLGMLRIGSGARTQAAITRDEIAALCAADAGLTKALFEMNGELLVKARDFSSITPTATGVLAEANSDYTFAIAEVDAASGYYQVSSTGTSGRAQKTISTTVRAQGPWNYAIFATGPTGKKAGKIEIKGYNVDKWSSDSRITASTRPAIGTNDYREKRIKLQGNIVVDADIVVAPRPSGWLEGVSDEVWLSRVIEEKSGAAVAGDAYAGKETRLLAAVTVPDELQSLPSKKYKKGDSAELTGCLRYDSLKVKKSERLQIKGNCKIYVERDVTIEAGAQLVITENACLELYIGKKLEVKKTEAKKKHGSEAGGIINLTEEPARLKIYGLDTCEKIKIEDNSSDFYGVVHAPSSTVEIKNSKDVYGAIIGVSVKLKNDDNVANFYYDQALKSKDPVRFAVGRWTVK